MSRLAAALLAFPLAACRPEAPPPPATSESVDSAGIRIVTSHAPEWATGTGWTMDSVPTLSIGKAEGTGAEMLFRVTSASRFPDGRIALANSGTFEARIYGPDGALLATLGREGDGPGEFRAIGQVRALPSDTVMVWDSRTWRIAWFQADGTLVRDVTLDRASLQKTLKPPMAFLGSPRIQPDGSLALDLGYLGNSGAASDPPPGTFFRPTTGLIRASQDLSRFDTLTLRPGSETATFTSAGPMGVLPVFPPYQRTPVTTSMDRSSRICSGIQVTYEVECFAPDGAHTIIRWETAPPPAPTDDEIARWRTERTKALSNLAPAGEVKAAIDAAPVPPTREPYTDIYLDLAGNLWVRKAPPLLEPNGPLDMWVFAPDGRWLGEARLPPMTPLEIGDDYILGVQRDENDVEYLRQWRLSR